MIRKELAKPRILSLFWVIAVLGCAFPGCGKKTLPVPPMLFNPQPVQQLSHDISEGAVTLSFTFKEGETHGAVPVSGFYIDRARIVRSDTVCDTCPVRFKRIAEIRKGLGEKYIYREPLETGYRYIYKVTPFSDYGKKGPSPSTLQFDY